MKWNSIELQAYRNPGFGPTDRKINTSEALPTALYSWGAAVMKCPCGCRSQGLSPFSLRRKGLRGIEICSALWPHEPRHIHPRELQFLMGFSPCEKIFDDRRAQLCLQGTAVSPIQATLDLGNGLTPRECIHKYLLKIVHERDVTWPSPSVGSGDFGGDMVQLSFISNQTVGNLLQAEASLTGVDACTRMFCQGIELPPFEFLQGRKYQMVQVGSTVDFPKGNVPVFLVFLGEMTLLWAPVGLTYGTLVKWAGISEFRRFLDETSMIESRSTNHSMEANHCPARP